MSEERDAAGRGAIAEPGGTWRVKQWLEGWEAKRDRPTYAEVLAAGYLVVPADRRIVDAVGVGVLLRVKPVTVRKWNAQRPDGFPAGQRVGAGDESQSKKATLVWDWYAGSLLEQWAVKTGRWPIREEQP